MPHHRTETNHRDRHQMFWTLLVCVVVAAAALHDFRHPETRQALTAVQGQVELAGRIPAVAPLESGIAGRTLSSPLAAEPGKPAPLHMN